jgi:hypothetical protein
LNLARAGGSPYRTSNPQSSNFPFASRLSTQPAPLFFSATDEFREEDDGQEHEREIADFYALQRSRRHFGGSQLEESSEVEDDGSRASGLSESGDGRTTDDRGFGRGGGIKSSWRGGKAGGRGRGTGVAGVPENVEGEIEEDKSQASRSSKGKMVDVGLEDTMRSELDGDDPPNDLMAELDDDSPPVQQFRRQPRDSKLPFRNSGFLPQETDRQALLDHPRPPSSDGSSVPPTVRYPTPEPPRHDAFWGNLYIISLASLFATFMLVYLHTSTPSGKKPLGDTVYTVLHASYHLLAIDTVVAIIVSLVWLALLRSYVRALVYGILVAVPVILFSFSLYPFISSFKGSYEGHSVQDKVMRWGAFIPLIMAALWTFTVYQGRRSFNKAIGILEFACRILAENSSLLLLGFATLAGIVVWTWVWMAMFTRVFLGGHFSSSRSFVIDTSTWWLGVFFILVYLWTLGVISGIQRSVTAATVSQWYFHRLAIPSPTPRQITVAAITHSFTTLFGTVCLSTFLALMVRLPLLVLPKRFMSFVGLCTYSLIPTSIAALINPLTLTYASIHSLPLVPSSRGLSQMTFLSPTNPTTSLHPQTFARSNTSPLLPYRLSKLLLYATRFIMSLALGFGGWVSTARMLSIADAGVRGSLYAYIVGLIAGTIGWCVMGATEGVLAGVVDATVICWGSEVGNNGAREARYCREAGWLFGESEEGRVQIP